MNIIVIADSLTTIGFFICILIILRIKTPQIDKSSKGFYTTSVLLFFFISTSNILEHAGITAKFDVFEDYLEILFIPFIFFSTITHIYIQEIHKRKKIQTELILAKEKAEENDKLKSSFLANLSHEIRTPMNSIVGFSNLLELEKISTDTQTKYLQIIKSSSKQLLLLINDILDISKIEANQLNMNYTVFDLQELFDELLIQFSFELSKYEEKDVKLILNKGKSTLFKIYNDKERLKQVLSNLLSNAIKFTPKGLIEFGYIDLSNNKLKFYVKDTGIGISDEFKKVIFNRFSREKLTSNTTYGGTGIGLAISKGLVNLLEGEIFLESEKSVGSTFYFVLPLKQAENEEIIQVIN